MIRIKLTQEQLLPHRSFTAELNLSSQSLTKICGDNGVGKSTFLAYCQQRQAEFFNSQVCFLDQKNLTPLSSYSLDEVKNILSITWKKFLYSGWEKIWDEMMQAFELRSKDQLENLSGGQNQLVKLMVGAMLDRKIYLWDEPFQFLDPKRVLWWKNWMQRRLKEGATLLIIDHSEKLDDIADSIYRFEYDGYFAVNLQRLK